MSLWRSRVVLWRSFAKLFLQFERQGIVFRNWNAGAMPIDDGGTRGKKKGANSNNLIRGNLGHFFFPWCPAQGCVKVSQLVCHRPAKKRDITKSWVL